jgi:bifunctional DNA primase/polymerase-like protein
VLAHVGLTEGNPTVVDDVGWKFFVLGRDKSPLPNCERCRTVGPDHDRELCACLTCHGFYAATADRDRLAAMATLHPHGAWAVRTGAASGIIVLDAEGEGEDGWPSGVEVLDSWSSWTDGPELPSTPLVALTPSGGVHRFYDHTPGVRSRNRVLPGVDLKADGGYVLVPVGDETVTGRRWLSQGVPTALDDANLAFLTQSGRRTWRVHAADGTVTERPGGYDYRTLHREGCPGGLRDEFFNELIFRLRKAGVDLTDATSEVHRHWSRCAQPPEARWFMPWHHVQYKIERVWRTVEPDVIPAELLAWASELTTSRRGASRVTLAPREGRR